MSREGTNDPEPESFATDGRKRKRQQVSTLQARIKVVKWMVEDEIKGSLQELSRGFQMIFVAVQMPIS